MKIGFFLMFVAAVIVVSVLGDLYVANGDIGWLLAAQALALAGCLLVLISTTDGKGCGND